jgi:hypothetical protein
MEIQGIKKYGLPMNKAQSKDVTPNTSENKNERFKSQVRQSVINMPRDKNAGGVYEKILNIADSTNKTATITADITPSKAIVRDELLRSITNLHRVLFKDTRRQKMYLSVFLGRTANAYSPTDILYYNAFFRLKQQNKDCFYFFFADFTQKPCATNIM